MALNSTTVQALSSATVLTSNAASPAVTREAVTREEGEGDVDSGWRAIAQELEASNQELQKTNDRLLGALEELQSLNLALQSVNDALHGNNGDLRSAMDTLRATGLDLERMLNGVDVGAVLVDPHLSLRAFNATALRFMSLAKQDVGKSIRHLRHDLGGLQLSDLCRQALLSGEAVERVLTASSGETVRFVVREIALDSRDSGLILTFSEIGKAVSTPRTRFG